MSNDRRFSFESGSQPDVAATSLMISIALPPESVDLDWGVGARAYEWMPERVIWEVNEGKEKDPEEIWKSHKGIARVDLVLTHPEVVTSEMKAKFDGTLFRPPDEVMTRDAIFRCFFQGVSWGGIRSVNESNWPVQVSQKEKGKAVFARVMPLVYPDRQLLRAAVSGAVASEKVVIAAGDFERPLHVLVIDARWNEIEVIGEWMSSELRRRIESGGEIGESSAVDKPDIRTWWTGKE